MKPLNLCRIDLYFQYFLVTINVIVTVMGFAVPYFFVLLAIVQLCINIYHFITNLFHLYARHRSTGFTVHRQRYFWLTVIYVPIAAFFTWLLAVGNNGTAIMVFLAIVWLVIPQIVLYAYVHLCTEEVDFLEQNEFHILK